MADDLKTKLLSSLDDFLDANPKIEKTIDKLADADEEKVKDFAQGIGILAGSLVNRRRLRKKGASEAEVYFQTGVLSLLGTISYRLEKLARQNEAAKGPTNVNVSQTFADLLKEPRA